MMVVRAGGIGVGVAGVAGRQDGGYSCIGLIMSRICAAAGAVEPMTGVGVSVGVMK